MKLEEIKLLIDNYLSGSATEQEIIFIEQWYEKIKGDEEEIQSLDLQSIKTEIKSAVGLRTNNRTFRLWSNLKWVAAVFVIGLSIGLFYVRNEGENSTTSNRGRTKTAYDLPPGKNRAILILADGSKVDLAKAGKGKLTSEGSVELIKESDGLLSYSSDQISTKGSKVNTLSIPRGGKFQLVLSDGTKVWLNAATTLRYPVAFGSGERKVELVGEAYFEVAKDLARPFQVLSQGQSLEVLGTHFNVNAYADEPEIKSTLLEGSVRVTWGTTRVSLRPGQQVVALRLKPGNLSVPNQTNVEEAVAWKNEYFQFESASIKTILSQFSRWYDVEVIYEGKISDKHYHGKVSRNLGVSQALSILNLSGINFKIEGRKIIVK